MLNTFLKTRIPGYTIICMSVFELGSGNNFDEFEYLKVPISSSQLIEFF